MIVMTKLKPSYGMTSDEMESLVGGVYMQTEYQYDENNVLNYTSVTYDLP